MGSCTADVGLPCLIKPTENGKNERKKKQSSDKILFFVVVIYRLLGERYIQILLWCFVCFFNSLLNVSVTLADA